MRGGRIAVIGGGMSGMAAAILLAKSGRQVVLLERQERIGKKLLLTGNGRCNISNTDMGTAHYRTDSADKLAQILSYCDADTERAFWDDLGMEIREVKGGLYPMTNQAATVLDCLRFRIEELGVHVHTEVLAEQIRGSKGNFRILYRQTDGSRMTEDGFESVLLGCGGLAGVYKEREQNGYLLTKQLDHTIRKGHPALVPVVCAEDMKAVAGVRVQAKVSLLHQEQYIAADEGELQLTKDGISGIPVFQLTRYLDDLKDSVFEIDFLPYLEEKDLAEKIRNRYEAMRERTLEQFFAGWLQKKLTLYLLKRSGIKADKCVEAVSLKQLNRLVSEMKHCRFVPTALGDYRQAQVSTGGIPLSEVDDTLESAKAPGVYILGEMLNVTGACGGYNLHFALATAHAAVCGLLR